MASLVSATRRQATGGVVDRATASGAVLGTCCARIGKARWLCGSMFPVIVAPWRARPAGPRVRFARRLWPGSGLVRERSIVAAGPNPVVERSGAISRVALRGRAIHVQTIQRPQKLCSCFDGDAAVPRRPRRRRCIARQLPHSCLAESCSSGPYCES